MAVCIGPGKRAFYGWSTHVIVGAKLASLIDDARCDGYEAELDMEQPRVRIFKRQTKVNRVLIVYFRRRLCAFDVAHDGSRPTLMFTSYDKMRRHLAA